jgi:hypothetical protein
MDYSVIILFTLLGIGVHFKLYEFHPTYKSIKGELRGKMNFEKKRIVIRNTLWSGAFLSLTGNIIISCQYNLRQYYAYYQLTVILSTVTIILVTGYFKNIFDYKKYSKK